MGKIKKRVRQLLPQLKYSVDPMSTHKNFLSAAIAFVSKSNPNQRIVFFEIGTGGESSRIMRQALDEINNSRLVSFENNPQWIEKYRKEYAFHKRHSIVEVNGGTNWNHSIESEVSKLEEGDILLAFIDSAPWESRVTAIETLKNTAQIAILHDCDYFPHNGILGHEISPILFKPRNLFRYGKMKKIIWAKEITAIFLKNGLSSSQHIQAISRDHPLSWEAT